MPLDPRPTAPHALSLGMRSVNQMSSPWMPSTVKPKARDLSSVTKVDWPPMSTGSSLASAGVAKRSGRGGSSRLVFHFRA